VGPGYGLGAGAQGVNQLWRGEGLRVGGEGPQHADGVVEVPEPRLDDLARPARQ
jgi:hypothetical protein